MIKGKVTVLANGEPIFGAEVCARLAFPEREYCVFSDGNGDYRLEDMPAGNYSVFVNDRGQRFLENCAGNQPCTDPQVWGLSPTQGVAQIDVVMDAKFSQTFPTPTPLPTIGEGSISGSVIGNGAAVANMSVCASGQRLGVTKCTVTNANGLYSIVGLPTDNYKVEYGDAAQDLCYATSGMSCDDYTPVGVVSPFARSGINRLF